MTQPSALYRSVEDRLDGSLADLVAARRPAATWEQIADEIAEKTGIRLSRETLRLWFVDRITVEVKIT